MTTKEDAISSVGLVTHNEIGQLNRLLKFPMGKLKALPFRLQSQIFKIGFQHFDLLHHRRRTTRPWAELTNLLQNAIGSFAVKLLMQRRQLVLPYGSSTMVASKPIKPRYACEQPSGPTCPVPPSPWSSGGH
jgi:hypothetical protein